MPEQKRRAGVPALNSYVRVYYNGSDAVAAEGRVISWCADPTYTVEAADGSRETVSSSLGHVVIPVVPEEVLKAAHLAAFPGLPEGIPADEARRRTDAAARVVWEAALREAGGD